MPDSTPTPLALVAKRLGALVIVVATIAPVVLGLVAAAVVERSLVSGIRGAATAMIFFFPAVLLGLALLPLVLDPTAMMLRRWRSPAAVAGWILMGAVWLILSAPSFSRLDCCEGMIAVQGDLRLMASQQEQYYERNRAYSQSFEAIGFIGSSGVEMELEATERGWSARTTSEGTPDFTCAMWGGEVSEPLATGLGSVPSNPFETTCGWTPVPRSLGRFGRFLESYHGLLEEGWVDLTFL